MNISWADGLVYELAVQRLNQPILVFLVVIVVVADEYFVPGNLVHVQGFPLASGVSDGIISNQVSRMVTETNR